MIIHVVQNGETIEMIANKYGVSADRLILENDINNPDNLVVGETIVVLIPEITYTIQQGDTLGSIADRYGITALELLRNNPYLSDRDYIYPGEIIVIQYEGEKLMAIETNSYAYPFINRNILIRTLPFLTYLTVIGYTVTADGEINDIDDTEIIRTAKAYDVVPIMLLEAFSANMEEEIDVIQSILSSEEKQNQLISRLLRILDTKGYGGVNINTPYIRPEDRILYGNFFAKLYESISMMGYKVYNTLTIRVFQLLSGTIFTNIDFTRLSQNADGIILITYEFGYSEGIPLGTIALDTYKRFFENVMEYLPPDKTFLGVSVFGYLWEYPYVPGVSRGMLVNYNSAIEIAAANNSEIKFDEINNIAYFQYISANEYMVRFWDARSIDNFVKFIPDYGLHGISVWNSMSWFPQIWLIINSQFIIEKVL